MHSPTNKSKYLISQEDKHLLNGILKDFRLNECINVGHCLRMFYQSEVRNCNDFDEECICRINEFITRYEFGDGEIDIVINRKGIDLKDCGSVEEYEKQQKIISTESRSIYQPITVTGNIYQSKIGHFNQSKDFSDFNSDQSNDSSTQQTINPPQQKEVKANQKLVFDILKIILGGGGFVGLLKIGYEFYKSHANLHH